MANPRVFITTDIGSYDKDDDQSMVHLLLYGDKLNIVGFSSSPPGPGDVNDIHEVINAYAKDYSKLQSYSSAYQSPAYLHDVVHAGATQSAPSAGYSSATDGSRALVAAARASSPTDPLYVLSWGGETDVAQALHDAPDIAANIRLMTIDRQDANATAYLEKNWKGDVWWIQDVSTFRGIYAPESGQNVPMSNSWAATHAKGHGALGDYFYNHTFDLYAERAGSSVVNGIKMGDTPTVLYLIDRANNNDPTAEGWGGEFVKTATNYWTDNKSSSLMMGNWYGARTVAEDRSAIFADFAVRLDRARVSADGGTASAPSAPATVATIRVGMTEAESLSTSSYAIESHTLASAGKWLKASGTGSASGVFDGTAGTYRVAVRYFDEADGTSAMSIAVNGQIKSSWSASANNEKIAVKTIDLALKDGDTITVKGTSNSGEFARLDRIDLTAVTTTATTTSPSPSTGTITGTSGSETLNGTSGNDVIKALAGNDILKGNGGTDTMYGGVGNDVFYLDGSSDIVTEYADEGTDKVMSSTDHVLRAYVENLTLTGTLAIDGTGNSSTNIMHGNAAANELSGLAGGDNLYGQSGNDRLLGGDGNDRLYGDGGADRLEGDAGNDALLGGTGTDTLFGGTGADLFDWDASADIGKGSTRDIVLDFTRGVDRIELSGIDARADATGNNSFVFIGNKAFTGVDGQLRFYDGGSYAVVQGDTNGDKVADFEMRLDNIDILSSTDFVL